MSLVHLMFLNYSPNIKASLIRSLQISFPFPTLWLSWDWFARFQSILWGC